MHRSLIVLQLSFAFGGFITTIADAEVLISEEFTVGPGCLANLDADVFTVSNGVLTVGTSGIRGGCNSPPGGREYRHALCGTNVPSDFVLDVDVLVESRQEYRAGIVYGLTDPQRYYIFHFNDYENGVLQLIRFDGVTCFQMLASPQFDSLRDQRYHVRIEVSGDRHRVFVDDTLRIDVTDPNYAGGQIGLSASFNGYGRFDNLLVNAACLEWQEIPTVASPSPRRGGGLVYDSRRGVSVLFGGDNDAGFQGDTWEWNGVTWSPRSTTGPAPRTAHAMAYDSARGVTVMFGGVIGPSSHGNDTWEWDGNAWTLRSTAGPAARYGCRMSFDSDRNVVVLFGGVHNGSRETWEWNGATGTLRSTTGPAARYMHAMVYDTSRRRTVLFGGLGTGGWGWMNDTWEWDGSTWVQCIAPSPSPRSDHAMAYDAVRGVAVLFGGVNWSNPVPYYGDTWEWNGASWAPRVTSVAPSALAYHGMAYDAQARATVLFGGSTDTVFGHGTWGLSGCPTACQTDEDCDDGLFCNGRESCTTGFCEAGAPPCSDALSCDEITDGCLPSQGAEELLQAVRHLRQAVETKTFADLFTLSQILASAYKTLHGTSELQGAKSIFSAGADIFTALGQLFKLNPVQVSAWGFGKLLEWGVDNMLDETRGRLDTTLGSVFADSPSWGPGDPQEEIAGAIFEILLDSDRGLAVQRRFELMLAVLDEAESLVLKNPSASISPFDIAVINGIAADVEKSASREIELVWPSRLSGSVVRAPFGALHTQRIAIAQRLPEVDRLETVDLTGSGISFFAGGIGTGLVIGKAVGYLVSGGTAFLVEGCFLAIGVVADVGLSGVATLQGASPKGGQSLF